MIVNVSVKPESVSEFLTVTGQNHLETRNEPGNLRFDVLCRNDDPNRFVLYEAYRDEAGFLAHQQTAHYLTWKETVASMMAEPRSSQKCTSLLPEQWP